MTTLAERYREVVAAYESGELAEITLVDGTVVGPWRVLGYDAGPTGWVFLGGAGDTVACPAAEVFGPQMTEVRTLPRWAS